MKPTTAFEEAIRPLSFENTNAARAALLNHPLAADFLLECMFERGVLAALMDGRVSGIQKISKCADPKDGVAKDWKETWPDRDALIDMLSDDPQPLSQIRAWLKDDKNPCGHWLTLHALWRLIKDGDVVKVGNGYVQSPALRAQEQAEVEASKRNNRIMVETVKKVGPPYDAAMVIAELRSRSDHTILKDPELLPVDQDYVDFIVKNAKEKGQI